MGHRMEREAKKRQGAECCARNVVMIYDLAINYLHMVYRKRTGEETIWE
jgi:hypothetical protein